MMISAAHILYNIHYTFGQVCRTTTLINFIFTLSNRKATSFIINIYNTRNATSIFVCLLSTISPISLFCLKCDVVQLLLFHKFLFFIIELAFILYLFLYRNLKISRQINKLKFLNFNLIFILILYSAVILNLDYICWVFLLSFCSCFVITIGYFENVYIFHPKMKYKATAYVCMCLIIHNNYIQFFRIVKKTKTTHPNTIAQYLNFFAHFRL